VTKIIYHAASWVVNKVPYMTPINSGQLPHSTRHLCQIQLFNNQVLASLASCGPCWIDWQSGNFNVPLICTNELHCSTNAHVVRHRWWTTLWSHSHLPNLLIMVLLWLHSAGVNVVTG